VKTVPITITIPVGPHLSNVRWLDACLASLDAQTVQPAEVLLIDDGANLKMRPYLHPALHIYTPPWRLGVAHAFNFGVALAENEAVIMLGSDDLLFPEAVELAYAAYLGYGDPLGYLYFGVQYSDGGMQNYPCNAALVTKELWKLTGGFPVEGAIGGCDTLLISRMMVAGGELGHLLSIHDAVGGPLYWCRRHPETETERGRGLWSPIVAQVRNLLIAELQGELVA
jgi:glycosyltransferase involved in cell wall biosynthesis